MTDQPAPQGQIAEAVRAPAIALLVYGIIGIANALLGVVGSFFGASINAWMFERLEKEGVVVPSFVSAAGRAAGLLVNLLSNFFALALAGLITYAGLRMPKLRDHGICMAGAIAALLPCGGCCCLIGMPIGIWALIVLNRADVRASFQSGA